MLVIMSLCACWRISTGGRLHIACRKSDRGVGHLIGIDFVVIEDGADAEICPKDKNQHHCKGQRLQAQGALLDAPHVKQNVLFSRPLLAFSVCPSHVFIPSFHLGPLPAAQAPHPWAQPFSCEA